MVRGMSLAVALALGFTVCTPAFAAEADRRQAKQQQRIIQGEKSGELTHREANRLERQHERIQNEIDRDRAKNGGTLTPAERERINRQQNHESNRIYNQKHDAQTR